jgi:hypothetical protein
LQGKNEPLPLGDQQPPDNSLIKYLVFIFPAIIFFKMLYRRPDDQSGRLLQRKRISCSIGMNIISWNISGYASGVYYIGSESNVLKNIKIIRQ